MNAVTHRGEALNETALEQVNGGGLGDVLSRIGENTFDCAKTGGQIGIYGGPVFAFGGIMAGAAYGAVSGVKSEVVNGIRSLIG